MKTFDLICNFQKLTLFIFNFSSHAGERLQATATSAQEISAEKFEQTEAILELTPPQSLH